MAITIESDASDLRVFGRSQAFRDALAASEGRAVRLTAETRTCQCGCGKTFSVRSKRSQRQYFNQSCNNRMYFARRLDKVRK